MKGLVLGAEGMLGSALMSAFPEFLGTTKRDGEPRAGRIMRCVDVTCSDDLEEALEWSDPDVVLNCAGIVKSECGRYGRERVVAINAGAPHLIARLADSFGCRVIHFSTDCVFSGARGNSSETDPADASDLYGVSKLCGEPIGRSRCLVLRTSFIGRDPVHHRGLLEWLLARPPGAVSGYDHGWSGLTALELARVVRLVLSFSGELSGLYHVAGPYISKADLIRKLITALYLPCGGVILADVPLLDRSLNGSRFNALFGYSPPSWDEMAAELSL